jgi:hypothetical protein
MADSKPASGPVSNFCNFGRQYGQIRSSRNSETVARMTLKPINKDHDENENSSDSVCSDLLDAASAQLGQG